METEIDLLKGVASGADESAAGTVRVNSIPLIVSRMLMPGLKTLYAAHPKLCIEAIAEPRNISLSRRDADVALRMARPEREDKVIARRIGKLSFAVYGPTRQRARRAPWITYETSMGALPHVAWINKAIKLDQDTPPSLVVNDSEVALYAIKAGVGKSLLPCAIGDRESGLIRLSGQTPILDRELWLLVLPELRNLARIKAVIEWLAELVLRFTTSSDSI